MNEKDLYQQYFKGLELAINSMYSCVVTSDSSLHTTLPIIEISPMNFSLDDETMDKSEMKFALAYQVEIYAKDLYVGANLVTVDDVLFDLGQKVLDYFLGEGFSVISNLNLPNIDPKTRRKNIRISGKYDTNRNVIYRK